MEYGTERRLDHTCLSSVFGRFRVSCDGMQRDERVGVSCLLSNVQWILTERTRESVEAVDALQSDGGRFDTIELDEGWRTDETQWAGHGCER
jgi:hypothetical protein